MGIIEIENLHLRLDGKPILNGLTMDIWEGHVHAVVGPNGAGKSTLAYTIMGLPAYRHFEGDIRFAGESLKDKPIDQRARLGITLGWQEPARFEGLKVRDFLRCSAKDKSEQNLKNVLEMMSIGPQYLDRAVDRTLSGGERKKIELASIIAMEPRVVLLDEPDSGIDVDSLNRIFDALAVFKKRGATVILITHSPTVLNQAEHVFLMCQGCLLEKGSVEKIMPFFSGKCVPCNHKNEPQQSELETMS
jgi:Fe-S cluster assembly ATP-binding protein